MPRVAIAAVTISALAFGSIIVRAADDAGVYEIAKQYNTRAISKLPQIFLPRPREVVRTSLSYAPVYTTPSPTTTIRTPRDNEHIRSAKKTVKVSPAPAKASARKSVAEDDEDFEERYLEARTSYCVRSCDGYFFPVGNPDSGDLNAHLAACDRACPAAETDVYVAPAGSAGIEDAVNRKGQRYESLRTAFNHRTQIDNACTCNPEGLGQRRNYSVFNDFTLRKGDMIMSTRGLVEFKGADSFPYRDRNFSRADLKKMSMRERKSLSSIEAYSVRGISPEKIPASLKAQVSQQIEAARRANLSAEPAVIAPPQKLSGLLVRNPGAQAQPTAAAVQ